jgi:hypothetical protein
MGARGEPGELVRAVAGGGGWQVGFLIPADDGCGGLDHCEFPDFFKNRHADFLNESTRESKEENRGF